MKSYYIILEIWRHFLVVCSILFGVIVIISGVIGSEYINVVYFARGDWAMIFLITGALVISYCIFYYILLPIEGIFLILGVAFVAMIHKYNNGVVSIENFVNDYMNYVIRKMERN